MSDELLREAADAMGYDDFERAVADWLVGEHVGWVGDLEEHHDKHLTYWVEQNPGRVVPPHVEAHFRTIAAEYADGRHRPALKVARAYLGRDA